MRTEFGATRHDPTGDGDPLPTVHRRANYRVIVHQIGAFDGWRSEGERAEENRILEHATMDHASRVFGLLAGGRGLAHINIVWLTTLAELRSEQMRPYEVVVHLVMDFQDGLIAPWLRRMRGRNQVYRQLYEQYGRSPERQAGSGSYHAGLTLDTGAGMVSEVYPRVAHYTYTPARNRDNTNWRAGVRAAGHLIASTMFHEAMHNKVDPHQNEQWDLHTRGGGGVAQVQQQPVDPNGDNLTLLRQHLRRPRPPQALPGADGRLTVPD